MWIATRYGFFSIVCAHGEGESTLESFPDKPHPTLMMIRARKHAHLEALRCFYKKLFEKELPPIKKTKGTDYPYRIIACCSVVVPLVFELAEDIDYCNFKNAVGRRMPKDERYKDFLHTVWAVGCKLTPPRVKSGGMFNRIRWHDRDGELYPEPLKGDQ